MIKTLILCTGNICRSPMAQVIWAGELDRRGLAGEVASAGRLFEDRPASPEAVAAVGRRGLDLAGHRSQVLTPSMVEWADLTLGMERAHARDAIVAVPARADRVFTVKELARRARVVGSRDPDEAIEAYLRRAAEGRQLEDLAGASADDDIDDPYGLPLRHYLRTCEEISDRLAVIVSALYPERGADPT